jgi:serine/threonine protein phosphatase PrpC
MNKIKFEVFSATDKGLVRKVNEDCCRTAETPNGYLYVVCDGMGGHAGGATASSIAVKCIIQYLSKEIYPDARQALADALEFANLQIIGTATEHPELHGMGSTVCVLLMQNEHVWLAHAGDSRIYLYVAQDKCLHRLTQDHSYVQGLVNQGIITDAEAERHPNKNRILKALGISEILNPEVCRQPVLPSKSDIFLICSDGLSGMVSDKLIEEILSEKKEMKLKEATLMSLAKSAGGTDNITFQMALITSSPYKKSVFESKNPFQPAKNPIIMHSWTKYIIIAAIMVSGILIGVFSNKIIERENFTAKINTLQDSLLQKTDSLQREINLLQQRIDSLQRKLHIDSNIKNIPNTTSQNKVRRVSPGPVREIPKDPGKHMGKTDTSTTLINQVPPDSISTNQNTIPTQETKIDSISSAHGKSEEPDSTKHK